jgi:adenylate cyclase, class 2
MFHPGSMENRNHIRALEYEIKIPCAENPLTNRPDIETRLIEPRHFEDNWLFDRGHHELSSRNSTLRLRIVNNRGLLTFKSPPLEHPWLKVREEIQAELPDPESMRAILEALGFKPVFRYQKFRTVHGIETQGGHELQGMFDETPMGNFLELEGDPAAIAELVALLGIPEENLIQASYPALWMNKSKAEDRPAGDMIFDADGGAGGDARPH